MPGSHRSPRGRRPLLALIVVVLAANLTIATGSLVAGSGDAISTATDAPARPRTTPPPDADALAAQAAAAREAAVQELLDARAQAVLTRDRTAFLATVDPTQQAFVQQQAKLFDALAAVPFSTWSYEIKTDDSARETETVSAKYRAQWWAPAVTLRYAIKGYDREPAQERQYPTFVQRPGGWLIGSDGDFTELGRRTERGMWDFGPVEVIAGPQALVLTHPERRRLARLVADQAERSVALVNSTWGAEWSQRAVVLVPRGTTELNEIVGEGNDLSQIAAVATADLAQQDGQPIAVGDRVVVNPDNFAKLGPRGRRVVLTHEVSHVATRRATGPLAPTWLVEGFADYVGYLGAGVSVTTAARELRADVRAGRVPTHLPDDDAFAGDNPDLPQAYEASWLACLLVIDLVGRDGLIALYREIGAGEAGGDRAAVVDTALRRHVKLTTAQFTAQWQRYLQRQLG